MSAIKFGERLSKFMIPIALLEKFGSKTFITGIEINPGDVFLKEKIVKPEQCLRIRQIPTEAFMDSFPDVIQAGGISRARQEYLFKRIRPFVREEHKNELCPPLEE